MPSSQQSDATFVSAANETQVRPLSPRATYVIPKNAIANEANATFQVSGDNATNVPSINDQTMVVAKKANGGAIRKKRLSAASIMTEDDSDSEDDVPLSKCVRPVATKAALVPPKKNPKELFK